MRNCLTMAALFQKCETNIVFYLWIGRAGLQRSFVRRNGIIEARSTEEVISQKVICFCEVRVFLYSFLIVNDCFVDPATGIQGHSEVVVCGRITRLDR